MKTKQRVSFHCSLFAILGLGLFLLGGCNDSALHVSAPGATPTGGSKLPVGTCTPVPAPTAQGQDITTIPVSTASPTPSPSPTPLPTGTPGDVCFSESDYFFSENTWLELSITNPSKTGYITYTLDGSEPTEAETLYTEPLLLVTTTGDIPNVYSVRAKAWYDDGTSSDTYVHTYFLNESIHERYTTIVFSINGDPSELTDAPDGILYGDNYKSKGRSSERKVHIEAISSDGSLLFEQYAGARVFGGSSREHVVKSLKLFARKEYEKGKGSFQTTLFGSTTPDGSEPITKYDKLVLRNSGDDFQAAFLRDELAQRLADIAGFSAYEAVVPAVAYINGSYYGFYWLHESYCDKYFQSRNGKSAGEYVVLEGTETRKSIPSDALEAAAAKEFNSLYKQFAYADLSVDSTYTALCEKVAVENYLEYMAFNMYLANYDWPNGNYRCFRYYAAEGEEYGSGERDGRWRFLLHDADVSFGTYQSTPDAGAIRNDLEQVLGSPNNSRYAPLLAALLKREDCRQFFISKMLKYMNGALSYDTVCQVLDEMCAERDTELTYYFSYLNTLRWTGEIYASPELTRQHIERIRSFAKQRPVYMTQYIEEFFHLSLNKECE